MTIKTNKVLYWVLTGVIAAILLMSAAAKLSGGETAIEMATLLGGMKNVQFLGVLELVIVLFWVIPKTGVFGALLAIAYMGGAIAVHFVFNQSVMTPVIIQSAIWLVAIYRFPELRQRLFGRVAS